MNRKELQGSLFSNETTKTLNSRVSYLPLGSDLLKDWQFRIHSHQKKLFNAENNPKQQTLFNSKDIDISSKINPLEITPLPLSFWRWPTIQYQGPAIYLVMDRPSNLELPILLYIGETSSADKRWKGDHDCKNYLASYAEALSRVKVNSQLSIRFWVDVPSPIKARREVEKALIKLWLPPFNKETRNIWSTPFTNKLG